MPGNVIHVVRWNFSSGWNDPISSLAANPTHLGASHNRTSWQPDGARSHANRAPSWRKSQLRRASGPSARLRRNYDAAICRQSRIFFHNQDARKRKIMHPNEHSLIVMNHLRVKRYAERWCRHNPTSVLVGAGRQKETLGETSPRLNTESTKWFLPQILQLRSCAKAAPVKYETSFSLIIKEEITNSQIFTSTVVSKAIAVIIITVCVLLVARQKALYATNNVCAYYWLARIRFVHWRLPTEESNAAPANIIYLKCCVMWLNKLRATNVWYQLSGLLVYTV